MKRAALIAAATALILLLGAQTAHSEFLGTDAFDELTGLSGDVGNGGLMDRYPLSAYALDSHVDGTGALGAPDPGSWPAQLSMWLAGVMWSITSLVMWLVIRLVTWVMAFDFLTGPDGALHPAGEATQSLYRTIFGESTLQAMFALAGIWGLAMLVQRKHAKMVNGYAMSLVFVVIGLIFVLQPVKTATEALSYTNPLKLAVLAGTQGGTADEAVERARTRLFEAYVFKPWVVINFGKLKHCVNTDDKNDEGFPAPVSASSEKADICRDHIKTNASGYGGYAGRFLAHPPGSDLRNSAYTAIKEGKSPDEDAFAGWAVDKADSPAVDMMQEDGAGQRLLLSAIICASLWGAILLFGWIAVATLLISIILLAFVVTSVIALMAAAFPGTGHRIFTWWLTRVALLWFAPVALAITMAVILTISIAFMSATSFMGALGATLINGVLTWGLFLSRKKLIREVAGRVASRAPDSVAERTTEVVQRVGSVVATPVAAGVGAAWGRMTADNDTEVDNSQEQINQTDVDNSTHVDQETPAGPTPQDAPPPVDIPTGPTVQYGSNTVYDQAAEAQPQTEQVFGRSAARQDMTDVQLTSNAQGQQELSDPVVPVAPSFSQSDPFQVEDVTPPPAPTTEDPTWAPPSEHRS